MTSALRLFASCAPGLEPWLAEEARALGGRHVHEVPGGVELVGDATVLHRACLELGLAAHLLVRVAEFEATSFAALVKEVGAIDWSRWIDPAAPLHLRVRSRGSRLYHTGAVAERVRRGVTEALGREPPEGLHGRDVALHTRVVDDRCTLSVDVSGAPLHQRGYRLATAKAPLREDLARALVLLSGWDAVSPLADPLMGSGTIPIEAALLARKLPPGLARRSALTDTPLFDRSLWRRVREEALARSSSSAPASIFGSDRDPGALRAAEGNAERAGVRADLHLDQAPLSQAPFLEAVGREPAGALVTNPPHGRRIGAGKELRPLYQTIGRIGRDLPTGWRVALLAADRRLAMSSGLPLRTELLTDQGGSKVRVLVAGHVAGRKGGKPARRSARGRATKHREGPE